MFRASITLPDDLADAVRANYPGKPFSTALQEILRDCFNGPSSMEGLTEKMREEVCQIIQETLQRSSPPGRKEDCLKAQQIEANSGTDEWLTMSTCAARLPLSNKNLNSRKGVIARAVDKGDLETNGEVGKNRRVSKNSFENWVKKL